MFWNWTAAFWLVTKLGMGGNTILVNRWRRQVMSKKWNSCAQ